MKLRNYKKNKNNHQKLKSKTIKFKTLKIIYYKKKKKKIAQIIDNSNYQAAINFNLLKNNCQFNLKFNNINLTVFNQLSLKFNTINI